MAARRNLWPVSDAFIFSELNKSDDSANDSCKDDEEKDPSYTPDNSKEKQHLRLTIKQIEDPNTSAVTWKTIPSTSSKLDLSLQQPDELEQDEENVSAPQEDAATVNDLPRKRRVVNKVSPKKGRRRKKQHSRQERSKIAKNQGRSYLTYRGTGPPKSPRKLGPDCNCRLKCFEKVNEITRRNIFEEFNALSDFNTQNAYLFGLIDISHTARKTKKTESPSRRANTVSYSVLCDGTKVHVCKTAFLNIHGLKNNRGRVEILVSKKSQGISTPPLDKRGKHGHHKKKYFEEDINTVHSFIAELPRYESHYCRHKNPYKEFMSMEYTVNRCYDEYKTYCSKLNKASVSADKFRRVFTEEYNIGFKQPKTDTCKDCDFMQIELQQAKLEKDEEKVNKISLELSRHHLKAAAGQKFIDEAPKDERSLVLTFDLQQALPTPKLSTNPAFYKRKLFCYNLGIHDCSNDKGYFYFWDETTAKRGSDEIASCILKHFTENNVYCQKLIVISDNCGGQNKNWALVSLWLHLLAIGRVKESVEHVFPVVGHTMLPCDRDFGRVGNYVRERVQYVYSPDEWGKVLQQAQKNFFVYRMTQNDFFKISQLKEFFNPPVGYIASSTRILISAEEPDSVTVSKTYFGAGEKISIKPRGRPLLKEEFLKQFIKSPQLLYSKPIVVDKSKMNDVSSLLKYIPQACLGYYKQILTDSSK